MHVKGKKKSWDCLADGILGYLISFFIFEEENEEPWTSVLAMLVPSFVAEDTVNFIYIN